MPQLPIYTRNSRINTSQVVRRASSGVAESMGNFGRAASDAAVQWQKTQNAAESLDGKNKMAAGIQDLLTEAADFNDYDTSTDIENKQTEMLDRLHKLVPDIVSGFNTETNANDFVRYTEMDISKTEAKLKEMFRKKYIDNNNANLIVSERKNRENFIQTGDDGFKQSYIADLELSYKNGFIDKAAYTQAKLKIDDWDKSRMIYMANKDPNAVLEGIKTGVYGEMEQDARNALVDVANKKLKFMETENKIAQIETEWNLSSKLNDMSTDEALAELSRYEGIVSDKYFKAKRKSLLSDKGITAKTQADVFQELLLEIDTLDYSDIESYYSGADSVLTKIEEKYSDGYLGINEYKSLVNSVNKAKAKNIDILKEDDSNTFLFWGYSYKDASEFIKDNYVGTDGNKLLLDYFTAVNGKEFSGSKKKQILEQLLDKANGEAVGYPVFSNVDAAKVAFEKGELKQGSYFYLNGKLQKVD